MSWRGRWKNTQRLLAIAALRGQVEDRRTSCGIDRQGGGRAPADPTRRLVPLRSLRSKEPKKAVAAAQDALAASPDNPDILDAAAHAHRAMGETSQAIGIRQACQGSP